jgi:hypothetical protein
MNNRDSSYFSYALLAAGVGLCFVFIGIVLGKLFRTWDKAEDMGLTRPMDLSMTEQLTLFLTRPDISVPLFGLFFGGVLIFGAIVLAVIGIIPGALR